MKKTTLITTLLLTLSAQARQVCPPEITATTPISRFNINGDTVTDKATGLTWMRCSLGQTGNDCSGGSAKQYTWAVALNEVANNYSGWRIPNIKELSSIVELKCYSPAVNITIFPNTQSSFYWSSSPFVYFDNKSLNVNFDNGKNGYTFNDFNFYVRLVRGGR